MRRTLFRFAAFVIITGIAAGGAVVPGAQAQTPQNVYATTKTAAGPTNVNGFAKNATTGALATASGSPKDERLDGAAMAVDALGRFLFVANPTNNDISMFQINASNGALTEVAASPFAVFGQTSPLALATEPTGHYLFVAYSTSIVPSAVETYAIDASLLQLVPVQTKTGLTLRISVGMAGDLRGRNLYVAYRLTGNSGEIVTYQIDSATGALTSASDIFTGSLGRSFALDPQARFVYLGDGSNVGSIDSWLLGPVDSLPTGSVRRLTIGTTVFPFALAEDSTGKFIYAATSNGAHSYAIDQTTGLLTEVTGSPQNFLSGLQSAQQLVADPQGAHLYSLDAAGVHAFQIDLQTGLLAEIAGSPYAIADNSGSRGIAITGAASGAAISGPFPQFDTNQVAFVDTVVNATSNTISNRLVNNGDQALLINSIGIASLGGTDFSASHNCPVSLSPGAFCTINLTFTPHATGFRQASLDVADNGPGGKQSVALSGVGVAPQPAVTFVPGSLTFTAIPAGTVSAPQSVTVTNAGNTALNVSSVLPSGANPQDFLVSNGCTASADPFTISPPSVTTTVAAGHSTQYVLQISSAAGFSGMLQLQCTGAPLGATCSVAPPTTQITNGLPSPASVTVTVTTTGAGGSAPRPGAWRITPLREWQFPLLAALALLALLLATAARPAVTAISCARPRRRLAWGAAAFALFAAAVLAGCGGGSGSNSAANSVTPPPSNATPPGTYTLTVTANWSNVSVPNSLTLTVQ